MVLLERNPVFWSCPRSNKWLIDNLCYMLVNTDPLEAISVQFDYKKAPEGHLVQTQIDDHDRRRALWDEDLRWYGLKIQDMTG